jgi:hypothetical protein
MGFWRRLWTLKETTPHAIPAQPTAYAAGIAVDSRLPSPHAASPDCPDPRAVEVNHQQNTQLQKEGAAMSTQPLSPGAVSVLPPPVLAVAKPADPVPSVIVVAKHESFLHKVGRWFGIGLPIALEAAKAASPFIRIFDPAISPLFDSVTGNVIQAEQLDTAIVQGGGQPIDKLTNAVAATLPFAGQTLLQFGVVPNDNVNKAFAVFLAELAVARLNAAPAPASLPAPAAA